MRTVFAVDLGGTKTAVARVDDSGHLSQKQRAPAARTFEDTLDQITGYYAAIGQDAGAAGVTVPGIVDSATGNCWAPNLWGPDFHPLRAELERRLPAPVAIASDRTACVLAEQWMGAARGCRDVVFVAVGTGIGVGIVADGRPLEGAHGIAGAAGWMVVGQPWKPEYAERGGWETEAAGPALARRGARDTAELVVAAARAGDPGALRACEETADALALGVAGLISIFDPEIVVLGGGLMQAADLMLGQIRRKALSWTQPIAAGHVRIESTALGEDAALAGAARLGWLLAGTQRGG